MLRSDARDNRERILTAARAAVTAGGPTVPVREIASRAEVGVATVYRHFSTKQALLSAAFADEAATCADIVEQGAAEADPWVGFTRLVERLMVANARNRGTARAVTTRPALASGATAERERMLGLVRDLVHRAKQTGRLRTDVTLDDLVLVLAANNGIHAETTDVQTAAAQRLATLVLRSFRAEPAAAPPLSQPGGPRRRSG